MVVAVGVIFIIAPVGDGGVVAAAGRGWSHKLIEGRQNYPQLLSAMLAGPPDQGHWEHGDAQQWSRRPSLELRSIKSFMM